MPLIFNKVVIPEKNPFVTKFPGVKEKASKALFHPAEE
jgi:hypothetical protein